VAQSLNNLAALYVVQNRYADALPLVRKTIEMKFANRVVAFPVLYRSEQLMPIDTARAFGDSFETVQRISSSAAANAVSKLAARLEAGPDKELAIMVRQDQDLTVEADRLDKLIIAAVSKPRSERNAVVEDRVRRRADEIKVERSKLQQIFNQRF